MRAQTLKSMILAKSWPFATSLSLLPNDLRIGLGYSRYSRMIAAEQKLSEQDQVILAFEKLKKIVEFAFANIPFYRKIYASHGFHPSSLKAPEDWGSVPIVSKEDMQKAPLSERCVSSVASTPANTGGTSGRPLSFMLPDHAAAIEWAHMHELWKPRGYNSSGLKLRIGGTHFAHNEPFQYHPRHNELIVNSNCPLSTVAREVVRQSDRYVIRWIHGYPSLVAEFTQALLANGSNSVSIIRNRLYGVLLGSEFPAPVYRDNIENILSANVLSWYGHSEMALLAGETARGVYRSLPTYGFAEAVKIDQNDNAHLICSSMHNFVHPFIRYDTGDRIEALPSIGASLSFRITEGRVGDFVFDRNGRRLGLTAIIFGRHHAAFDDILHVQVKQDMKGHITLLIVPRGNAVQVAQLANGFDFSGLDLDWDIEIIDAPIRSSAGKVKLKLEV